MPNRGQKRVNALFLGLRRPLERLERRGTTYSSVSGLMVILVMFSAIIRGLTSNEAFVTEQYLPIIVLLGATLVAYALIKGVKLSPWYGTCVIIGHGLFTAYVLMKRPELIEQAATRQILPLLGMYLAWFYRPRIARTTLAVYVSLLLGSALIFGRQQLLAPSVSLDVAHAFLLMFVCMEVAMVWHRRSDAETKIDPLTGAATRDGMEQRLLREIARAERHEYPLSVATIDLDNFKTINDTYGHGKGDSVLVSVVQEIQQTIRSSDEIFRIGGDEFVVLMPHTSCDNADLTMQRLRADSKHSWTWGVAQAEANDSPETLLNRADENMYRAKKSRVQEADSRP